MISFFVAGKPQTKGSMIVRHRHGTAGGRCACKNWVTEMAGGRLEEWTTLVASYAARAMRGAPALTGPVKVSMWFIFDRPASHTAAQRKSPYVAVRKRYDADKLARAVNDALTQAAVWEDDSQAVIIYVEKLYADAAASRAGVTIIVEELGTDDAASKGETDG